MGTPYNPIIDSELTAPLELPAVPGKPLTTQGGNTLDDGSGAMLADAGLQLGSNFSGSPPDVHSDGGSIFIEAHGGNIWSRQETGSNASAVALAPGISIFDASGSTVATITDTGHFNPNPTTPALPANPPVSGTVYQNTTGGPIIITVPITATAIGGSGQWALGSTNAPGDWGGAEQIGVSGEVHNMTLYVPNNWYWSITATSATIGTASVLGL